MIAIEKKLTTGFAVALLVIVLIAAAAGWNVFRFDQTFARVGHTHAVMRDLELTLTGVLSMQSSARGFVLTGSEEILAPFDQGNASVRQSVRELGQLTADNPVQQRRVQELRTLINEAVEQMQQRIAERRARGKDYAREVASFLHGQNAVQKVRAAIETLEEAERSLLETRVRGAQQAARATIESAVVSGIVAIMFLTSSALLVRRDFRQRIQADQALRKGQRMFQRLFDDAPDAIIQVNRSSRIVRANRQAETLFGWSRNALPGQKLEALMPERYRARHGGHLTAYFAAPRTRAMGAGLELLGLRRDGSEFPVDILLSPLETDEGLEALAVIRDVTERRLTEEKIRRLNQDLQLQNARLEIANKELESFSYSVSHDLRAPLRHIDGFASLLSKHANDALDDKGRRFIAVISESARRMGRLIDDLLTFSRMGRAQMELAMVNQQQLVENVIREHRPDREVPVAWSIDPLPPVRADESMLRQVWLNLIDNAVKYSSHASPPRIHIGSMVDPAAPHELAFFVRDNGVGFDMKYAAKLFGVFQRLHSESEFEGTGIGLANVRRIITRHGGRTWAEGAVGAGSTFYFSLPTTPPAATGTE